MKHFSKRRKFLKLLLSTLGAFIAPGTIQALAIPATNEAKQVLFCWCKLNEGQIQPNDINLNNLILPGSLMKLIGALAISEENLLSLNEELECRGKISLHGENFTCQNAHGKLNLMQAVGKSCNCFFAQAAERVSSRIFLKYAKQFFPRISNISLNGHSQNYILGLSDSIKLSALEVLQMTATIATKGELKGFKHKNNSQSLKSKFNFSEQSWNLLHAGMRAATQVGTAKKLDPQNILQIAAKTGTTPWGNRFQSWVIGFFPFQEPKYAFCLWSPVGSSQESAVRIAHEKLFERDWK